MVLVTLECCICGEGIDENAHKLDPIYIQLNTNFGDDDEKCLEQGFFCHHECFSGVMDYPGHLNLEGQDQVVADSYLQSGKYNEAITILEELLPKTTEPEYLLETLVSMAKAYRLQGDLEKQKHAIAQGLSHSKQGLENADMYYEAAALAYQEGKLDSAQDYLNKFNQNYLDQKDDESEAWSKYDSMYFSAMLALNIAHGRDDEVKAMCLTWLDNFEYHVVMNRDELEWGENIGASIQHLQDPELMNRLAVSVFLRSSTPSLEFALKGLAARMRKDDHQAFNEFVRYKTALKEQVEQDDEDFQKLWDEMKSDLSAPHGFEIPDNDPPLQVLVDQYIEKYGRQ